MAYEQLQQSLLREQEKRRMIQRQMMKGSAYNPHEQVSGRSMPYSPIQGLTELGKAWLQKKAMDNSDKRTEALNTEVTQGREDAYGQFTDQYYGKDETIDQANMTTPDREGAQKADPIGAAMFSMQNPYLRDSGLGKAMMPAKERGSFSTYVDYTDPATGITRKASFDSRAPRGRQLSELDGTLINTTGLSTKDISLVAKGKGKAKYATDIAGNEATKVIERPKREQQIESEKFKLETLNKAVDLAISQTEGLFSTGLGGQITSPFGGSPAANLESTLSTIKANAGFDRLQEMRDNSKTGGALGAISELEIQLLMDSFAALKQKQSKEQLAENLKKFKTQYNKTWTKYNEAYKKDYGEYYIDPKKISIDPEIANEENQNISKRIKFDAQGNKL